MRRIPARRAARPGAPAVRASAARGTAYGTAAQALAANLRTEVFTPDRSAAVAEGLESARARARAFALPRAVASPPRILARLGRSRDCRPAACPGPTDMAPGGHAGADSRARRQGPIVERHRGAVP